MANVLGLDGRQIGQSPGLYGADGEVIGGDPAMPDLPEELAFQAMKEIFEEFVAKYPLEVYSNPAVVGFYSYYIGAAAHAGASHEDNGAFSVKLTEQDIKRLAVENAWSLTVDDEARTVMFLFAPRPIQIEIPDEPTILDPDDDGGDDGQER